MRNADICILSSLHLMTVRMRVTYLGNEREQHAQHDDANVTLGHGVAAWVSIHVSVCCRVLVHVLC